MIVSEQDAVWAADEFIKYYVNFTSIEDYLRYVKKEVILQSNQIVSLQDEFFNEDISPNDMEFDIKFIGSRFQNSLPQDYYVNLLKAVSSHNNESNIPGRELRWMVFEKKTQKVVGFIRFGSPTINSKPRNVWLGKQPDLRIFNRHAVMGFVIVPSQPFGYNYLGGKLLALLCCSHFAREKLNEVFEKDIALFETTSLYGSTTDSSQYDPNNATSTGIWAKLDNFENMVRVSVNSNPAVNEVYIYIDDTAAIWKKGQALKLVFNNNIDLNGNAMVLDLNMTANIVIPAASFISTKPYIEIICVDPNATAINQKFKYDILR